ncbi:MAG: RNA polymerase sporulation sigma factor SigE [Clostridia bacterium]|nr:RNA polymerase sporulation sigma factor SigE [Clostridia bacterium]
MKSLSAHLAALRAALPARLRALLGLAPPPVHYIHGSDTLPAPLTREREAELLTRLGEGDLSVRDELIEHNLRLVVYIARKFESSGIGVEDLISIGSIGLIKAVNSFQPSKGIKLATYASRCIENEILMTLRKTSNLRHDISIDEPLTVDWDGNELLLSDILGTDGDITSRAIEEREERESLRSAVRALGERERIIMEYRFGMCGEEHTQKDVADLLGISQSYISRLEKKILRKLRAELEAASRGAGRE